MYVLLAYSNQKIPVQQEPEQIQQDTSSHLVLHFGPYQVDRRDAKLSKHGLKIKLSGQPFEVLLLLLDRAGELVSREELRRRLWAEDVFVDFERSLNSAVKKLRRALNDDSQEPRYIETEPRKGYRFIAAVERVCQPTPLRDRPEQSNGAEVHEFSASIETTPFADDNAPVQQGSQSLRGWITPTVIGLAISIAAAGLVLLRANRRPSLSPAHTVLSNANFRSSIAVLALKNLSSGRDADWLATAMTQMLSTELANQYKARIITADVGTGAKLSLAMKEKGGYSREALRALRAELGSDYVVTGSYVALGDRTSGQVRMDLRLQEAISGETLASIAVSGKQSEIFDLVSRAGHQMRTQLGLTVPPDGDVDWRTVLPRNLEAARLYSSGLKHLRVSDNLAASESLQTSINLEPDFALGYAALAETLSALGYRARALAVAQKALSLSSSLPEDERMHIEGRYYELNHDWVGAMGAYRHLWQDFPDDVDSALRLASCQVSAGNWNDALATLSSVRSVAMSQKDDPRLDLMEATVAARSADYRRQQTLAEQALRKARSSGSLLLQARAQLLHADALGQQGKVQEAIEVYETAYDIFRKADDRQQAAAALVGLGLVLEKQADLTEAQAKFEQARDYFRQIGDDTGLNTTSTNLREIIRAREQLAERKSSAVDQ